LVHQIEKLVISVHSGMTGFSWKNPATMAEKTPVAYKPPGFEFFGAGNGIRKLPDKPDNFDKPQSYQIAIKAIPPVRLY